MKLIIDIDEDIYKTVCITETFGRFRYNTAKAIKAGIPLPKGHGRLIDADALINKCAYDLDNNFVIDLIDVKEAPTIKEADEGE